MPFVLNNIWNMVRLYPFAHPGLFTLNSENLDKNVFIQP
jgi:hypothetical protein